MNNHLFSDSEVIAFGMPFAKDENLDIRLELLKLALVSPKVSVEMLEKISRKLMDATMSFDKVLANIETLKPEETITELQLEIITNKISAFETNYQLTKQEIQNLLKIRPELQSNFALRLIESPKDILDLLEQKIFGQKQALESLSAFAYQWISYWNAIEKGTGAIPPPQKAKIVIGGTGTGKTFTIKELAKLLKLDMIQIDGASLVQSGYIGNNLHTEIVSRMINKNYINDENKKFLIFIDEFDKLLRQNPEASVKGVTVLYEFLMLLENKILKGFKSYDKNEGQIEVSLQNVIFILGGAFEGIEEQKNPQKLGFVNDNSEKNKKITSEDIIKYGMPRELMGRISTPTIFNKIDKEVLMEIVMKSDSGLTYYKNFFEREGKNFDLKHYSQKMDEIVKNAHDKNLGARGIFAELADFFEQEIINL